jgi:hypothetical protein
MRLAPVALSLAIALLAVGCTESPEPIVIQLQPDALNAADFTLTVDASTDAALAGDPVTFTYTLTDWSGADVTADYDVRTDISPVVGVIADGGGVYRFTKVDTYSYFASVDILGSTVVGIARVGVTAGAAASLQIDADRPLAEAGDVVTMSSTVKDAWGNPVDGDVTYGVTPSAAVAGNQITPQLLGTYTVTGTLVGSPGITATDTFKVESSAPISLSITLSDYNVERGDGIQVFVNMQDQFGNQVDHPVDISTSGVGTDVWGTFVRFEAEGIFTVYADVPEYGLHAQAPNTVLVDSSGPSIRVTTPARGIEIDMTNPANQIVEVTGSATDPWTGVVSFEINGEPVPLAPGGVFAYDMTPERGLNGIEIVAVDGDGNVSDHYQTFLWGEFQPPAELLDDGLVARLNEDAMNALEDFVADGLDTSSLFSGLTANLWTSPQYCVTVIVSQLLEVCGQLLIDVTSISIGGLTFDMNPNNPNGFFPKGFLDFVANIYDLEVVITLTGNFHGEALFGLITFDESVDMDAILTVDNIFVDTDAGFQVNSNHEIEVLLANTVTTIDNLQLSLPDLGFLGDIFSGLFNLLMNLFEPLINAILGPIVESQLPGLLEAFLGDLQISTVIDLLGVPLTVEAMPDQICIDDDGMTIGLASSASAPLGPNAPASLGSLMRSDGELPVYDNSAAFGLSIADNWVNQLLHAVWQAGVIDFSMDAAELGLDLSGFQDFLPLSEISFEVTPMLPPVVGPASTPDGLLELGLGDMLVNVYGDPGGTYGLMMQLAVSVEADAELTIDANNLIQFGIGNPAITMEFVSSDWVTLDGEVAERLMDAVVDLIIPLVTDTLSSVGGIPIPELPGFTLGSPAIERESPPAYYITAEGDLILTL